MIRRIHIYGDPVLRNDSIDIDKHHPDLDILIEDMFESMITANGIGLAAPQIGININLFVINTEMVSKNPLPLKKVFINPRILESSGKSFAYEEGCLSIPGIHEDVFRNEKILIEYYDRNFKHSKEYFDGINARVIQHEFDHLRGILFIDRISNLKKRLIKKRLQELSAGKIDVDYPVKMPPAQKIRKK
jgi:peptide deformylase